ncbi:MAG: SusC/RagA family TonB-linked outer membrane protein, partial [Bacteroidota bacterium]
QSVYAFAKIGYKDIIFLDITGRNDWSSALATPTSTDNVSFFYPSVAAAYIASNHLDLPEWVSFAKARASWAQVGNDTDPYQTAGAFIAGTPFNSQPTFTSQDFISNGNLLPEKTSAIELGADVRFFNDRVRLDVAYYNALTENQIVSFPVAVSSGYNSQVVNGGAVRSTGVELLLGVTPVSKEDFSWTSFFNFTTNKSVVEELPEGADKITLGFSRVYDNVNQTVWFQVEEGGEIGDMFGTGYLTNENGDFVLTEEGNFIADNTLRIIGNANPDFMLGWNNQFNYKNWELSFLLDWRHGGELVSRTLSLAGVGGQLEETENRPSEGIVAEGVVNVGTDDNPVYETNTTAISAESYYRQFYDRNHEVNNVYNASYVKLRQFSLGYTFNSSKDSGFLQKGRTFRVAFIGRNVFAISEIPHFDPEQFAVQGNQILGGVEDMSYPTARSFGLKLSYQL